LSDSNNKNDHIWCREEEFDGGGIFFKVLIRGVTQARAHGLTYFLYIKTFIIGFL
jgi:hypothetical protein